MPLHVVKNSIALVLLSPILQEFACNNPWSFLGAHYTFFPRPPLPPDLHLIKAIKSFIYDFISLLRRCTCKLLGAIPLRAKRDNTRVGTYGKRFPFP